MLGRKHTALLLVLMMLVMPALGRDDGRYANSSLKSNIATATYRERPLELSGTYHLSAPRGVSLTPAKR